VRSAVALVYGDVPTRYLHTLKLSSKPGLTCKDFRSLQEEQGNDTLQVELIGGGGQSATLLHTLPPWERSDWITAARLEEATMPHVGKGRPKDDVATWKADLETGVASRVDFPWPRLDADDIQPDDQGRIVASFRYSDGQLYRAQGRFP
jgi:hypothetical protein